MIGLARLTPSNIADLHALGRTPTPPQWVEEVEEFVLGEGARDALLGNGTGLIAYIEGTPVGAAFLKPHDSWSGAELLRVLLIGFRNLGQHLAQPILEDILRAPGTTIRGHIIWMVHPDNEAMQIVSSRVASECIRCAGDDGYDIFIFDR
ncbi:MAG: hypothetical protein M5T61_15440 [Acidimicrobiia bacterium]|nr:hypothetical protein [Acidimicrobiia bacterium]